MSTAVFELTTSIKGRIAELQLLCTKASEYSEKNDDVYNVLCRSCCVLIASHIEGFLKDLSSSIIADLNYYIGQFDKMPAAMQRAFCMKIAFYEGVEQNEIDTRIKQLMAFFKNNNVPIDMSAFTYKENPNKNTSSDHIDKIFSKFGINNITASIAIPRLLVVFEDDHGKNYRLARDIKKLQSHLYKFPYRPLPKEYAFSEVSAGKKSTLQQTLWHTFIEEILTRRHLIAHGDTTDNVTTHEQLEKDIFKTKILMYGVMYSATSRFSGKIDVQS